MNHDPTDIEGQEVARIGKQDQARVEAQTEADDIKWLMARKQGRRIMQRQLERAGVFRSSFNTNSMTMAFTEGQRNEGLKLLAQIMQHAPDRYIEMTQGK